MPDGSTYPLALRVAEMISAPMPDGAFALLARKAELAREAARLDEVHTEEANQAASELDARWLIMSDAALESQPTTLADAAAVLLRASYELRDAVNQDGHQSADVPCYLAIGRVINFLVAEAGIDLAPLDPDSRWHSMNGPDPQLAANWYVDRVLEAGGQFWLRAGKIGIYFPDVESEDDAAEQCRLFGEFRKHDVALIRDHLSTAALFSPEYHPAMRQVKVPDAVFAANEWMFVRREHYPGDIRPQHLGGGPLIVPTSAGAPA